MTERASQWLREQEERHTGSMEVDEFGGRLDRRGFDKAKKREDWEWRVSNLILGNELWEPVHSHPAYAAVLDSRGETEATGSEGMVRHLLTHLLLPNAVHAAGAIEYTVRKIVEAHEIAQEYTEKHIHPKRGSEPGLGLGLGHPAIWMASVEFINLVAWGRNLSDRLKHDFQGNSHGLIPALAHGSELRHAVEECERRHWRSTATDVGTFGNYGVHLSAIPYPNHLARLPGPEKRVTIPIPDPVDRPITGFHDFTFKQDRDLASFAESVLDSATHLIDCVLAAFDKHGQRPSDG